MNKMQEAARKLHSIGFKTLPIRPNSKEPAFEKGVFEHGAKDATIDDGITDEYYGKHPDHGIGVSGDGFIIFDFDVHDGVDGRDAMLGWDLPDTLAQTTPSGGYHLFYRADEDFAPSVNSEIAVDVRAHNSYVVCDPTPGYVFEDDCDVAHANDEVLRFLDCVRPTTTTIATAKGETKCKPGRPPKKIKEGEGRNNHLFKFGCSLRSDERNTDEIIRLKLQTENLERCDPPVSNAEMRKIIGSVLARPAGLSDEVKKQQESRPKRSKFSHVEISKILMEDHGFCFADGVPAVRMDGNYAVGWNAVDSIIIDLAPNSKHTDRKEVHHYLAAKAERKQQAPPNLIAFKNGVLDIDTMELRDWEEDDVILNVIPHNWNPDAACSEVDNVLDKMSAGDLDVWSNLIEVMGCCMYRSNEFGQAAILLGAGSNGKSTYIKMLRALVGSDNASALSLGDLGRRFHSEQMMGKLANLGDDISNEFQRGNVMEAFKKTATGDQIYADVKGERGFTFSPYCQLVFSANEFPRIADSTDGTMRRIFPIEFNATFKRTDPDYNPRITQIVTSEEACERMCVLGVAGLHDVMEENGFTATQASKRIKREIKADNDTIVAWIDENLYGECDFVDRLISSKYDDYSCWAENSRLKPVSRTVFTKTINKMFNMRSKNTKMNGKDVRVFSSERSKLTT